MTDKNRKNYSKQEIEKKHNFTYLTTNTINNKQYVGEHSTNDLNTVQTKYYLGGGILLKKAIKKYGRKYFKREILEYFSSKQESFMNQEKYIISYNTLQPNGYNISHKGGNNIKDGVSLDTKQKISKSLSGKNHPNYGKPSFFKNKKMTIESRKKLSDSHRGHIPWNKGIKYSDERKKEMSVLMSGKNHPNYGKHLSEETKMKIGIANKNIIHNKHDEETKLKIKLNHARANLGKKASVETKEKMSAAHINKKRGKYNTKIKIKI